MVWSVSKFIVARAVYTVSERYSPSERLDDDAWSCSPEIRGFIELQLRMTGVVLWVQFWSYACGFAEIDTGNVSILFMGV